MVPLRAVSISGGPIGVVIEPGRARVGRELLGAAAELATATSRGVVAIPPNPFADLSVLSSWGADEVLLVEPTAAAEDLAEAIERWAMHAQPWAVLMPSTMWPEGGRASCGPVGRRPHGRCDRPAGGR